MFDELQADGASGLRMRPRDLWLDYMRAVVGDGGVPVRCLTERKTGLYGPNVETVRLVRDDRGWLRLAG